MYLFREAEDCCEFWFGERGPNSGCATSIIKSVYTNITSSTNMTEVLLEKWYPLLGEGRCINDKQMPNWMLSESFREYYLFGSREACCASFGFC